MDLRVGNDSHDIATLATAWLEHEIAKTTARTVFIPAGSTPKPLYALWRQNPPPFIDSINFLQMDDVISGNKARCFQKFLKTELAPWQKNIHWITTATEQAELAIVGLGLNGHVAFHEPGLPQDFFSGCVRLSQQTCTRLELESGTWGVSYGLGAFLKCRSVLMIVTGQEKQKIFRQFRSGSGEFPALALLKHPRLTVLADKSAQ